MRRYNFLQTALKSIQHTGIVYPSSRWLVKKMIKNIDFSNKRVFVEFGTGDGCLTEALLSNMTDDSILFSFEMNDSFYAYTKEKFSRHHNLRLLNEDAFKFYEFLESNQTIDCIISSLPLALFEQKKVSTLINSIKAHLSDDGQLIQYQYSLNKLGAFKSVFHTVKLDLALLNLPPAFVYTCI